jgi:hypothetical protein
MILWPLSHVLSPRALHSTNVFLIKVTVSIIFRVYHYIVSQFNSHSLFLSLSPSTNATLRKADNGENRVKMPHRPSTTASPRKSGTSPSWSVLSDPAPRTYTTPSLTWSSNTSTTFSTNQTTKVNVPRSAPASLAPPRSHAPSALRRRPTVDRQAYPGRQPPLQQRAGRLGLRHTAAMRLCLLSWSLLQAEEIGTCLPGVH